MKGLKTRSETQEHHQDNTEAKRSPSSQRKTDHGIGETGTSDEEDARQHRRHHVANEWQTQTTEELPKQALPQEAPPPDRTPSHAITSSTSRHYGQKVITPGRRTETREVENKNPKVQRHPKESTQPVPAATAEAKNKHPPPANNGQPEPGRGQSMSTLQQRQRQDLEGK